ncbi:MAG: hypothetical protein LZF86_10001 [Nitrospira sp.]|nr:MAG: hypothetical protein LZF86_10001 [Nitrospira sp.]
MPLSGLHTFSAHKDYTDARDFAVKLSEHDPLRSGKDLSGLVPKFDRDDRKELGNLVIGYGLDLRVNSVVKINDWYSRAGLTLSEQEKGYLAVYQANPSVTNARAVKANLRPLSDEPAASRLFAAVVDDFEAGFTAKFGPMAESNERAALVSLVFNRGINNSALKPLISAIQNDLRAEAWFQIRYNQTPLKNAIDPDLPPEN